MEFRECKKIYMDHEFVAKELAQISIKQHAFHFGTSVFDSIAIYGDGDEPNILALDKHVKRINQSARLLGLQTIEERDIQSAIIDFIKINQVVDGYIRIIIYPDKDCLGIDPSNAESKLCVFGWHRVFDNELKKISLSISPWQRPDPMSTLPYAKVSGLYAIDAISIANAKARGFDEALLLNQDGSVCEVSGANIFYISKGKVFTPNIDNTIVGITKEIIKDICQYLGVEVVEKEIILDELILADEVFISGTYHEITQVSQIDGYEIKNVGQSLVKRIYEIYNQMKLSQIDTLSTKWISRINIVCSDNAVPKVADHVEIRFAEEQDKIFVGEALGKMVGELRGGEDNPIIDGWEEAFYEIVSDRKKGFIMVATYGGKIVGFIGASFHVTLHTGGLYASFEELWTNTKYRKKFVGVSLMREAENYIKSLGIKRIDLGAAGYDYYQYEGLYNFYKGMGYIDIGPRFKKILTE